MSGPFGFWVTSSPNGRIISHLRGLGSSVNDKRYLNPAVFDSLEQLRTFCSSLKKRELPLKMSYLGSLAHAYDQMVCLDEFGLSNIEVLLLQSAERRFLFPFTYADEIDVIDIGSGNGLKACALFKMAAPVFRQIRYIAVDYSHHLLCIAADKVKESYPNIEVTTYEADFEEKPLDNILLSNEAWNPVRNRLFLLLGHTLGNPFDRAKALRNIRDSMIEDDVLIIGVDLNRGGRAREIVSYYDNSSCLGILFNLLEFAGIQTDDGSFKVTYNESQNSVNIFYRLKRDLTIWHDESLITRLVKGDDLHVLVSHRFTEHELEALLMGARLRITEWQYNEAHTYALIQSVAY